MGRLAYLSQTYWGHLRRNIIHGCEDCRHVNYHRLGARGIKVCDQWRGRDGLKAFRDDIVADIGERPSSAHGLTRINECLNFEPGNMCWLTNADRAVRRARRVE